jgi:hypothetical protein
MVAFRLTSFPIDNQSREQAYVLIIPYSLENVTKAVQAPLALPYVLLTTISDSGA